MENARKHRVKVMSRSALGLLKRAAEEAEALPDQSFAEDLWDVCMKLERMMRAAERRKYVKQGDTLV